ncbi:MAG: CRISPR-associated endonuclease Cas1 [Candidatus Bathyarchaeia archaeon]
MAISEFGASLHRVSNRFLVITKDGRRDEYSSFQVQEIHITNPGVNISAAALRLALKRKIVVMLGSRDRYPIGFLEPVSGSFRATLRKLQYLMSDSQKIHIASKMIEGKLNNQRSHLLLLAKNRRKLPENGLLKDLAEKIKNECIKLSEAQSRMDILTVESRAAKHYWEGLAVVTSPNLNFHNRIGRGAVDPFNVVLNFGYQAYLFRCCWKEIVRSGFDPYDGFLHSKRPGKPSLVLDIMEEFRPLVDRVCLSLFTRNTMPKKILNKQNRLSKIAYATLLETLHARLQGHYHMDDRIADQILKVRGAVVRNDIYKPYKMSW